MKKLISTILCLVMILTITPLEIFAEGIKNNKKEADKSTSYSTAIINLDNSDEKSVQKAKSVLLSASEKNADATAIPSDDSRLSEKYLMMYSVPNAYFSAENNGGELNSNVFNNVFDRNWNTLWRSNSEQINGFTNTIDVTFNSVVSIDRIIYGADTYGGRGYPTKLKISFANNTENYTNEITISSTTTSNIVIFDLGKTYECTKIQFEWLDCPKNHRYEASAREIIFLQHETVQTQAIDNLFSDYNCFTLNEKYNSALAIEELEQSLKSNINYDTYFKSQIDRAKNILNGELVYNPKYEFSTSPENSDVTKILQHGGIRSYAQNTLRLAWFGIDRQTTGLYAKKGDIIKVYVDADENENCLPTLSLTQHYRTANTWKKDYTLKKGLNLITVPDFGANAHTSPKVAGGGPVYISNPYTADEQGAVKVYIENTYSFPVYRKLDENSSENEKKAAVTEFLNELKEYCSNGFVEGEYPLDLIELQSDHCLMTVKASLAENMYITSAGEDIYRVQNNLENYDAYMERLLEFEGITLNKNNRYYDVKNEYLNINFRACQATGVLAYATSERVGLLNDSWQNTVLYSTGIGRGWGLTHEIGHTLDMHYDRVKHELTNNMLSKYNETALGGGDGTRGDFNADIENLSSDRKDYTQSSYLNSNMYNYCIWWHLESYSPGYWGTLANMYRYYPQECDKQELALINTLDKDEKQVYYSSLILGIDLGYYYERYGFKIYGNKQFTEATATDNYKTLMANAVNDGRIDNKSKPRFWYLDEKQYNIVVASDGVNTLEKAFQSNEQTVIKSIEKTENGYSLIMPAITDSNTLLGYEIYEGQSVDSAQVIGFSKTGVYIDSTVYEENYTPKYWVKAYNRDLTSSAISNPSVVNEKSIVCTIGENKYSTLKDAVKNASDGDTIVVLSDIIETGIVIDKNITITVDDNISSVTHYRGSEGSLFTINENCTLTINGNGKLILDGNSVSQKYPLVNISKSAVLNIDSVTLQNSINSAKGGAIYVDGAKLNATNCNFINNSAANGGAIAAGVPAGRITIDKCIFKNNNATQSGGAIHTVATIDITKSEFSDNFAKNGGAICNTDGGVIRIYSNTLFKSNNAENGGAVWINGLTNINNTKFVSNSATSNGGGIYYTTTVNTRSLSVENSIFEKNSCSDLGNEIYADINSNVAKITLSSITIETSSCLQSSIYIAKGKAIINTLNLLSIGISNAQSVELSKNSNNVILTSDNGCILEFSNADIDTNYIFPNIQIGSNKRILGRNIDKLQTGNLSIENVNGFEHTESDWFIDKDATCTEIGNKHTECTVCKKTLNTETIDKLNHSESDWIIDTEATCTNEGSEHKICTECETEIEVRVIPATGHNDSNGDGYCDTCDEYIADKLCSCMCHSTNSFTKFIWKILSFFYKIFGTNKSCSCGIKHY